MVGDRSNGRRVSMGNGIEESIIKMVNPVARGAVSPEGETPTPAPFLWIAAGVVLPALLVGRTALRARRERQP
ncbi:MAG: hypothetical protein ABEJ85_00070 [Haloarculaceae archaeon]